MRSVRFAHSKDDVSLAWTRSGSGPRLVKTAAWLTHLEYDPVSPIWSHWIEWLEGNFDYLRYDERGCGLSDRTTGALGIDTWMADLQSVLTAARFDEPFAMMGMSQGSSIAINYAVRNPDKVSKLVLYGGYARGQFRRGDVALEKFYRAVIDVLALGWEENNPAFNSVFTSRFILDGTPEQIEWFRDLLRRTTRADLAAELLTARAELDVTELLSQVQCPTLIFHCEDDQVAPLAESEFMARRIPGSELVVLPGKNHILQKDEPAWAEFKKIVGAFLGGSAETATSNAGLSARELQILDLICQAKSNKEIARELDVSEKTVRNHATNLFAKLGVKSRQEAILAAGTFSMQKN